MEEALAARNATRCFDRNGPVFPFPSKTPATRKDGCQMETGQAVDLVRHTLLIALTISAPMLLIGLVVGIVISLLQAVTQIQEQTLSFIPKIVAMVAAAILLMPWTAQRLMDYSREMFTSGLMN
jgi:flagellar biosynthetic protein FliQ